ncbi:MAG TPA: putative Ig domain-containing protein [Xanthomonadales bacterium]|nr:putative Ig domain-containing protein [Xanthomonadales bacterium]
MTAERAFTPFERVLALVTRVRAGEGRTVALYGAHVFLILFAYYIFRSVREGLLLESGSAARGSYATAVIAALLMVLVPVYGVVRRRYDGARLVNAIIAFFITTLVVFWLAARAGADVAFAFYVWVGIFNVMMIAQFWALAADSFNVKTGQRLFPAIMLAAQLGALCGAQFTESTTGMLGTNNLLLVGTVLLLLTASFTGLMRETVPAGSRSVRSNGDEEPHRPFGGFQVIAASRYLALIALMIVLINWISSTGDFIHRDFVKRHFDAVAAATAASTRDLVTAYMANFFFWMIVLQLVIQVFVVGRLFRMLGVATALLIPAALSLIGYAAVGFLPLLTLIRMVRMGEQSIEYSLTNTLRQALFLPTTRAETYEGKTAIETFFWRFGDLVQAGVVFAGTTWLGMDARGFALLNALLAGFWIAVAFAIGRHYRELAARNLTNAAPQLTRPIPHAEWHPDEPFEHALPRDLFVDHDPGDVLTLSAQRHDGSPLPDWLRFDARRHRFHGVASEVEESEIVVQVVATDHDGVSVSGTFVIRRRVAIAGG